MERHHTTAVRVQGGRGGGAGECREEELRTGSGGAVGAVGRGVGVLCKDWPIAAHLQRMDAQSFRKWVFCGDTASLSLPIVVQGSLCFEHLVK